MTRQLYIVCIVSMLTYIVGCSSENKKSSRKPNALPPEAAKALHNADEIELLSLEPYRPKDKPFTDGLFGYKILGTTTITDPATKTKLIADLNDGVAGHNGKVAECFNPRHALKCNHTGQNHVFMICFECSRIAWYIDGKFKELLFTSESPQPAFDEILKKANVLLPSH
jgi:hypothetical protein